MSLVGETRLIGKWHRLPNGRWEPDSVCTRIHQLLSSHLEKVAVSKDGWDVLYQDPDDGRFWELTHPRPELHGEGPPALIAVPRESVQSKYPRVAR